MAEPSPYGRVGVRASSWPVDQLGAAFGIVWLSLALSSASAVRLQLAMVMGGVHMAALGCACWRQGGRAAGPNGATKSSKVIAKPTPVANGKSMRIQL
jgi:hypothetical protein